MINFQKMGVVLFSPKKVDQEELDRVSVLICPRDIRDVNEFVAVSEWAALTQTPIYCINTLKARLKNEGFGDYRVHSISPYQQIHMYGGTLEFIPVKKTEKFLFFNRKIEPEYFHILLKPFGEDPVLYLSTPQITSEDLAVCKNLNVRFFADKEVQKEEAWASLEKLLGKPIEYASFEVEKKQKKSTWKAKKLQQHILEKQEEVQDLVEKTLPEKTIVVSE